MEQVVHKYEQEHEQKQVQELKKTKIVKNMQQVHIATLKKHLKNEELVVR
jgi:hypothetical protein